MKMHRIWVVCAMMAAVGGMVSTGRGEDKPTTTRAAIKALMFGHRVPELAVTDLAGKSVKLDDFKGKPVVIQFASITEPVFRKHVGDSEKLAKEYAGKVTFVVIYQRESHGADEGKALEVNDAEGFQFASPATQEERIKLAKMAVERLGIKNQTVVVDAFNDTTSIRFGGRPNATFLVDGRGGLAAAYPWVDAKKLKGAIEATLKDKVVPPEFQGPVRTEKIPAAAFETGDGRLSLAVTLDSLKLDDKQKQAVYPPIAELLAEIREFREIRNGGKKEGDDLQIWIGKLREKYTKVQDAVKGNLPAEDSAKVLEALDKSVPPRLLNVGKEK